MAVSRQRKYQLRMQRDKRCSECGEPARKGSRCLKHLVKAREQQRKARGLKRRYYGTLSYKLQTVSQGEIRARKRSRMANAGATQTESRRDLPTRA